MLFSLLTSNPPWRNLAAPFVGPLDGLPTMPASAWGCQRLFTAYNGPILRLIRSSDNAELDWYAMADGELDLPAILAWSAGGSGYSDVVKMYSQITGGSDLEQTTPLLRPNFSGGGVVNTVNGKPAPQYFVGSERRLDVVNWFDPTNMEVFGVAVSYPTGAGRVLSLTNDFSQDDYNSAQRMAYFGETYPGTRKTGAYYNSTDVGVSPVINMNNNPYAFRAGKAVSGWAQNINGDAEIGQSIGLGALANPITMGVGCGKAGTGIGTDGFIPTLLMWHGATLPILTDFTIIFRAYAQARFGTP